MLSYDDTPTGAAAISVDIQGNNSIIVALGANEKLRPQFLTDHEYKFTEANVLLMQFETNLEAVDCSLRLARKSNPEMITILNPAPAFRNIPDSILQNVDYLTPNETELELISGHKIITDEDITIACSKIKFKGSILATLGKRGSFLYRPGHKPEFIAAHKVNAIDTSGAGDAFNGAFASALVQANGDCRKAATFATAAAAISVTRPGTSASMASLAEIRAHYKDAI